MAWISELVNPFRSRRQSRGLRPRHGRVRAPFERLESRLALANTAPSNFPIQLTQVGTELFILYSQPDASGFAQTSDQHVVIDIDEFFAGIAAPTQRVNVYASTNPATNFGAPIALNQTFLDITGIHVTVPNYDAPGVNNNSLTIKGINGPTDRIIVSGSGRTAAGRWSDEAAPQLQIVFDVAGIDDLTVTAGGVINVSGAFTNDTGDASIHAIGEIAERQADQTTATIIVGETTPTPGSLPQSRLVSNYIEIIGAEIDIYSDIEASGQVILRQPATTPQTARANLILPYDITVSDPAGVLELHSTKNIVQLQSSTLVAHKAVAISNIGDINVVDAATDGPWLIDLGSVNNDFDTISLGMVSNAIDTPSADQSVDARGRIGVRDIDDLTVADFGILATTGIVTLRSVGPLTIDAAVQATGLLLQSDTSVATTPRAVVSVNSPTPDDGSSEPVAYVDLGVTIDVSSAAADDVTGNVILDGRIVMDLNNVREDEVTTNKTSYGGVTIHAAGVTNLNSQILTLGDIRIHSQRGIHVNGQLQAGGTFISKNGTVVELVAADLSLTTASGDITVTSATANLPLPTTLSATNLLAMDAGGDISIGGSLFAGSLYNSTAALPTDNNTLPSITIRAIGDVEMAQTAVLKTRAYGTNYNASPNPQIGLITVSDANAVTSAAAIDADGAFTVSTRGDITLSGATTAREAIWLRTQAGDIDVQGGLFARGAIYTSPAATPPFVVPVSWTPSVTLDAPNGAITTSDTGVLTAGASSIDGKLSPGQVVLNAQQSVEVGADIASASDVLITSKLAAVNLDASVKAGANGTVAIVTAAGVSQGEFGAVAGGLSVTNTNAFDPTAATDIELTAAGNAITSFTARNQSAGGKVRVATRGALSITGVAADGDIEIVADSTLTLAGPLKTMDTAGVGGDITLQSLVGGMNVNSSVEAAGMISITSFADLSLNNTVASTGGDVLATSTSGRVMLNSGIRAVGAGAVIAVSSSGDILSQGAGGVTSVNVITSGSSYSAQTTVTFAAPTTPPSGVTPYPAYGRPVIVNGQITAIEIVSPGVGYQPGEQVAITITDPGTPSGNGATAIGLVSLPRQSLYADGGVTLSAIGKVELTGSVQTIDGPVVVNARQGVIVQSLISAGGSLGDIAVTTVANDLDFGSADAALVATVSVTATSQTGSITVNRATAGEDVELSGADGVTVIGNVFAGDDVSVVTGADGRVSVRRILAGDSVTITAGDEVELLDLVDAATGGVLVTSTSGGLLTNDIYAELDITLTIADQATLLGVIDSESGDISITSRNRDLDFTSAGAQLNALQGGVSLAAVNGTIMSPPTLRASKDVTLTSFNTLALNNEITSDTGVIDLKSTSGSINLGANLDARDDSIRIHAKGSVTQIGGGIGFVRVLNGGSGYTAAATVAIAAPSGGGVAARAVPIIGRVNGVNGVITGIRITNPGSGYGAGEQPTVTFTRNAVPPAGAIDASVMAVASPALGNSGLAAIDVVDGGSGYTAATTVTIAAPVGGGTAATAQAVIGTVEVNGVLVNGVILDIVIVNPGSGYGAGEQPVVTITGAGTGAVARAIANIALQDIRAGQDIDIYAGTGVTLLNTIRADQGHVSITSETGNVNLTARTLLVSSFMDDIEITSRRGAIAVQRLAADGDITVKAQTGVTLLNAVNSTGDFDTGNVSIYTVNGNIAAVAPNGLISVQNGGVSLESVNGTVLVPQVFNVTGDVSLKTFGNLTINNPLTSSAGSVTLASATGAVNIAANVFADERVTLSAKTGISQTKGSFIKGNELVASNSTTSAVNLTNPANDFANVSLVSLGAVSYVDANDFETGVERSPYSGTPLGVEVRGESLNLSSVATNSRIRVVSGLSYKTLSIAAGTQGGNNVGYVEYVTTSTGDNPQANAAFRGTLRDMIRYTNDNTATYVNAGNTRVPQPQMMVFDETGYLVEEVTPAAALPAFSRPVWFDGGRLEETATANRLGISGNNSLLHGLSFAPATPAVTGVRPATPGSSGSRVENLAVYGFTKGSGVVLASGNNTVVDLHAGLKADGTVSGNMIGLDVRGAAAINNTIGEQVVDAETVNRFAANTMAGIMIRNGAAGTQVFGSVIGDDSGANPALANGDGIQIVNATRSQIGSANAVEDDLYPSRSNIIAGNLSAGVRISNAVAGTLAAANVICNNVIRGNRTGVDISASAFAVLGGPNAGAANVIAGQTLSGVVVTDSRSVQIQGNRIGVVPAFGDQPEAVAGNGADGIAISGKSQAVEIGGGNWIGGNTAHGVRIGSGVTGVMMAGNTIGGTLADGSAAGNGQDGVAITAAIGNTIGAGNVIARNGRHGVSITDARAETLPAGNRVFGSTISGNRSNGVLIGGGSLTTIGGPTVADANLIQGNEADGIRLVSTGVSNAATGHVIQRNYVGSNPAGDVNSELGNKGSGISLVGTRDVVVGEGNVVMNNGVDGIAVNGGRGVTIGSANAAGGNQIRHNAGHGVSFNGAVVGGRVMGNQIGFQGGDGVFVGGGAQDVRIGHIVTQSAVSGAANVVRGNAGWGVRVMPGAQRIAVQGNSSFGNMQGAMSRAAGANAAAPSSVTLTSAVMRTATGGTRQLVVTGTIAGARARQQYSVDVYASSVGESAQGRRHLGRFNVTATADGLLRFNSTITATVAVDEWISVAATTLVFDPGATSQFSAPVKAALR